MKTKLQVTALCKRIREISQSHAEGHYEMAQIFNAIRDNKLFELMDYETFFDFCVGEQLPVTNTTAYNYAMVFRHAKRLGYNRNEMLELFAVHPVSKIYKVMCQLDRKVARRTFAGKVSEYSADGIQFNFSPSNHAMVTRVLKQFGMSEGNDGRRVLATEAFEAAMQALDNVNKRRAS